MFTVTVTFKNGLRIWAEVFENCSWEEVSAIVATGAPEELVSLVVYFKG